jgi:hypothetical protein
MEYGPAILAVTVTVLIAVMGLFFRAGGIASRVEELERWRGTIRADMREISDVLEKLGRQITNIETLLKERTSRRGDTV